MKYIEVISAYPKGQDYNLCYGYRPNVDSIVLAARNKDQLHENIVSYNLKLTDDDIRQITDLTALEPIYPLWHRAINSNSYNRASDSEKIYFEVYSKMMKSKNRDL
ncbi:hypothetical protein MKX29_15220 [Cytobacillus sp. FSL R7-0696]|uniref:hypothetical protein n=1 Tax=Cytobacillus sp. FSL R7-0696 TaxID=2921691 RepID=UPI0030F72448